MEESTKNTKTSIVEEDEFITPPVIEENEDITSPNKEEFVSPSQEDEFVSPHSEEKDTDYVKPNRETDVTININNGNAATYIKSGKVVNKVTYILLALFLGGFGVHNFYAGKIGLGILYLVFFWTYVPAIAALIQLIIALTKRADANGNIVV